MLSLLQPSIGSGLMSNVTLWPLSLDQLLNSLLSSRCRENIFRNKSEIPKGDVTFLINYYASVSGLSFIMLIN